MTPEEQKAKELVDKFLKLMCNEEESELIFWKKRAKQCALICVEQIIKTTYMDMCRYWQEVKVELQKL